MLEVRGEHLGRARTRLGVCWTRILVDVHTDPDHHRSVFTSPSASHDAGPQQEISPPRRSRVSIADHDGVHPRVGALDVVPFVALGGTNIERAQRPRLLVTSGGGGRGRTVPVFSC